MGSNKNKGYEYDADRLYSSQKDKEKQLQLEKENWRCDLFAGSVVCYFRYWDRWYKIKIILEHFMKKKNIFAKKIIVAILIMQMIYL